MHLSAVWAKKRQFLNFEREIAGHRLTLLIRLIGHNFLSVISSNICISDVVCSRAWSLYVIERCPHFGGS